MLRSDCFASAIIQLWREILLVHAYIVDRDERDSCLARVKSRVADQAFGYKRSIKLCFSHSGLDLVRVWLSKVSPLLTKP